MWCPNERSTDLIFYCCVRINIRQIAAWFTDYPGWPHIYSLHHLVHCGMSKYDKAAGQWVGPATAAYLLR